MSAEEIGEAASNADTLKALHTPAHSMRLATFNLESFGYARKASATFEERAEVLRPQLERLKADVLCLQEVDAPKVGPRGDQWISGGFSRAPRMRVMH